MEKNINNIFVNKINCCIRAVSLMYNVVLKVTSDISLLKVCGRGRGGVDTGILSDVLRSYKSMHCMNLRTLQDNVAPFSKPMSQGHIQN